MLVLITVFTKPSENAPILDINLKYSFKYPVSWILISYTPLSIVSVVGSVPGFFQTLPGDALGVSVGQGPFPVGSLSATTLFWGMESPITQVWATPI